MSESARSVLKHLYKEGRMTEEQFQKIDRNLKARQHGTWRIDGTDYEDGKVTALYVSHEFHGLDYARFVPDRSHEEWEYLKEHITEMRDADGELNQKQTCQFILELMGVIEREGEASDKTSDNK